MTRHKTVLLLVVAANLVIAGARPIPLRAEPAPRAKVTLAPPAGLTTISGNQQVALMWEPSEGATSYVVLRRRPGGREVFEPVASNVPVTSFIDVGLTNDQTYIYRVRAVSSGGASVMSRRAVGKPHQPPPADAPANLQAIAGNAEVTLTWDEVAGAQTYLVFRTSTGTFDTTPIATTRRPTYRDRRLTNGVEYAYRVAGHNKAGDGPLSDTVQATPVAPTGVPTNVTATGADGSVTVMWAAVTGATGYNVYRGTSSNGQLNTPVAMALPNAPFLDTNVVNGTTYFYEVTAIGPNGESARSSEASATPMAPPPDPNTAALRAFRLLRHATWGPKPGDVDHVLQVGADGFLAEQFAAPPSVYPTTLFDQSVEVAQEHFMQLALSGSDQLRQRVAFALHKIWVASAVEVNDASAIVTYYSLFMNNAFGNYRDLMKAVTLNPAMGRYLNMLNNRSQTVTGVPANENYPRELLQLFTMGLAQLNPDGTPVPGPGGDPVPTYSENDVKELARIFTGWTFGDGNPATIPTGTGSTNYRVPMEAVARYHDTGAKTFLGVAFPANQTAEQDLDQALDVIFGNPNVAPFISKQLIQQLVTSNPSNAYVASIASIFTSSGGNLGSVVRAILTHPEANAMTPTSGKLTEPVLFATSLLRALNAAVTDHPFMSDRTANMGQRVFYPPSVFSYFSPSFRVAGTGTPPLLGPEFQTLTTVTALERANFVGALLGGHFGDAVVVDYTPFLTLAADPAALVDHCDLLFMGGRMSTEERNEIIAAVTSVSAANALERARTAIYLTEVAAQAQVDR